MLFPHSHPIIASTSTSTSTSTSPSPTHPSLSRSHTGSDDLIGRTVIDLEDRWFDARWQKMGEENVLMPGADPNDPTKVRACVYIVCA